MVRPIKVAINLDLEQTVDRKAYDALRVLSAKDRKTLLLSFTEELIKTERKEKVLKCLALVIATGLIFLSVHFTYEFNALVMAPVWAMLLSCALVLFTNFAAPASTYVTKGIRRCFLALWIIGISYSIFTALAGQYNEFRSYHAVEVASNVDSALAVINQTIDSFVSQIANLEAQKEPFQKLIDDLSSSPERRFEFVNTWKDANAHLDELQTRIDTLQLQLNEYRARALSLSTETSQVETTTIYTWLARLFHVNPSSLEFFVLALPSCFIDLASSLLTHFALGKRRK